MKEHIQRELVNALRDIAIAYHDHGCLLELIGNRVAKALKENDDWYDEENRRGAEKCL